MIDSIYALQWEPRYYTLINRYMEKVRVTKDTNLINNFLDVGKKAWNDHKNTVLDYQTIKIPTIGCGYGEDLCTYPGLARCMKLIIGSSSTRWSNLACGSSSRTVTPYDTDLGTYITDVQFSTAGYFEANGASIAIAATFPASTATNTIREMLVADSSGATPTTVLSRNVFSDISHTQNTDFFTLTELIELVPII